MIEKSKTMDHVTLGLSLRPPIPPSVQTCKTDELSVQFMLLHIHCEDYVNGEMKVNEGDNEISKFQDSSEYVDDYDDDTEGEHCLARVVLFGCMSDGVSVCVSARNYRPWIRIQVRENLSESEVQVLRIYFEKNLLQQSRTIGTVDVKLERRKQFYGWQPDPDDPSKTRTFCFAKISFDSFSEATRAAKRCKTDSKATFNNNKPPFFIDLVDTQIKSPSRFCNDLQITMSDWVLLKKAPTTQCSFSPSNFASRFSNCQIEIECDVAFLCMAPSTTLIAPLLLASIDGEMYSNDGAFPDFLKGDNTIYIGISLWKYGSNLRNITRVMFCVSETRPILPSREESPDEIHLFHFSSTKIMFEAFRDFLVASDPDIVTGWNTFGFDYPFLIGEYKQHYLPQGERGSERLQMALFAHVPSSLSTETPLYTASELLYRSRMTLSSYSVMSSWISKMNYSVGIAHTTNLLKEEKLLTDKRGNTRNLSSFSSSSEQQDDSRSFSNTTYYNNDEDEDEEEDDNAVPMTGLAAFAAKIFRKQLMEDFPIRSSVSEWDDAFSILRKMSPDMQQEFKKNIADAFPENLSTMILKRRPQVNIQRGLFLSRFASEKCVLVEKRMSSAARGDNIYSYISMTGRVNIDLMQIVKDDKKPESNTLKFAAKTFLDGLQDKIDLSASEMFEAYRSNDSKKRGDIAVYCARDCDIPLHLISKLSYIPTWIEMSRVCFTALHDVVNSGQQVKVMNLIARFVCDEFAINLRDSGWPDNEVDTTNENDFKKIAPDYEGATVIEPATGFYEDCVSTLDFESLYPSIIRYFNLCPSTLVLDQHVLSLSNSSNKNSVVKFEPHVIKNNVLVNKKLMKYETQDRTYTFAMHITGVLPSLLKRLIDARKAVKKMMNESTDPAERAVLNGRQNGLKVACNSCYGFCGVSKKRGLMPCKPVAAVTTLKGRLFIDFSKNFTEKTYPGSKVIYGDTDSVMVLWGKGTTVERANELGEEAAFKITKELREGKVSAIGGAGSLSASIEDSHVEWRGRKDLAEACSAVRLTNEKVYFPYLLLKKKNYAAIKFTSDGKGSFKEELDMKGIDAVRRDRSQLVRNASNAILHSLLYDRSVTAAMISLKQQLQDMAQNKVPIDLYVLSKSLKSNYSSTNLPHVMAWKRMIERGDEGVPPVGARMPYVILSSNGLGGKETSLKLYERSEHPDFAKSTKRKLDLPYYIESLFNPIYKLLQFCNVQDLKAIFKEATDLASNNLKNIGSLSRFTSSSSLTATITSSSSQPNFNPTQNQTQRQTKPKRQKLDKTFPVKSLFDF